MSASRRGRLWWGVLTEETTTKQQKETKERLKGKEALKTKRKKKPKKEKTKMFCFQK
jgi:hypothetical protein